MKYILFVFVIIFAVDSTLAQAPSGKAKPGDYYGKKIDANNAIAITEVYELLKSKDTILVKVKAKALASCASKGCWMTLQIDDTNSGFVKMKDYGFFVPTAIANKMVVLEGIAFTKITSIEELKHYAEDAKKSQAEIDAITEPKKEIRFLADGILVVKD
jgi:hypothetical protein